MGESKHTPGPWQLWPRNIDEAKANARLIAAAPDLVEPWQAADNNDWDHLFAMLPDSGHGRFWKEVLTKHRAALAKARGAQ